MSELDPPAWVMLVPIVLYLAAIGAALLIGRRASGRWVERLPSVLAMAGAGVTAFVAIDTLLGDGSHRLHGWQILPFARVALRLDPLAAFFLLVLAVPAIASALFGIGYLDAQPHREGRAWTDALFSAFLGSMTLVFLADSVFTFLIAWELMSLVSFFLVVGDGHNLSARRAGFIYVVMTHIGTAFLIVSFMALFRNSGSLDFSSLREASSSLGGHERSVIFLLALIGFATKAGLIPLHVWLPRAHPAAPSHVSALMSGVMVKTAIYGLLRVMWEFTGSPPYWWGGVLVALGAVSAVLGILYALMERDIKRVLAYSTVEHVGIITIGVGIASMLTSSGHPTIAALALLAALVHLFNHSTFKGLLFLGAGAVQSAAGSRDLERLGGLAKRMPRTSALFLVGALAIAALPPLNGFAGEWLLFQSLLGLGAITGSAVTATLAAGAAGALALTGALAVACFVRLFGVGFLAQPRSSASATARDVGISMQIGMALLAALCIALGIVPGILFRLLEPVTAALVGAQAQPSLGVDGMLNSGRMDGAYAPIAVLIGAVLLGAIPWLAGRALTGSVGTRTSPTWVCGVQLEPRMQYSATAFAKPLRLIFQWLVRPYRAVELERPHSPWFVASVRYQEGIKPVFERHVYQRGVHLLLGASHRVRAFQGGSIRAYLAYIFVTLVVVLLVASGAG